MKQTKFFLIAVLLLGSWAVKAANVITVTSVNNDGAGSLREAIEAATLHGNNVDEPSDTIRLNVTLSGDNKMLLFDIKNVKFENNSVYTENTNIYIKCR